MIRLPPTSTPLYSSAASDVYKRQVHFEPEDTALPDSAFRSYDAPHQFDQTLSRHQADARAFLGVRLLSETIERLKKLRQFIRRQTFAAVLDTNANASWCARNPVHDDRSAHLVVFDRVGKKIDQNLLHPCPVGFDT